MTGAIRESGKVVCMTDERWTPEQLAEAGVDVAIYRHEDAGNIYKAEVFLADDDGYRPVLSLCKREDEAIKPFIARAYTEAARIVKERQRPRVWWWHFNEDQPKIWTITPSPGDNSAPFVITDGRVVGETPEEEFQVLAHAQGFSTREYCNNRLHRLYSRLAKANAAIAAARKENNHE